MEINELLNAVQNINNSTNKNESQNENVSYNNFDFNNDYFKSQYPSQSINISNSTNPNNYFKTENNIGGNLTQSQISPQANNYNFVKAKESQVQNINSKSNLQYNTQSVNNNSNLLNMFSGLINNQDNSNTLNILKTILPLLSGTNGGGNSNNLIQSLVNGFGGKKNTQTSSLDIVDDEEEFIDVDNLIKIDDT